MGGSASKVDSYKELFFPLLQKQELVSNKHNKSSVQLHRNVRSSAGATNPTMVSLDHVVDHQSVSDSLKELTSLINKTNEQATRSILDTLESNKDIKKNLQLFDLVREYFSNSFRMSRLCNALEDSLTRVRDRQLILRVAIQLLKEEEEIDDGANNEDKYLRAMEELKKFKDTENPFAVFAQELEKVLERQQSLVDKLNHHNKKIEKKLLFLKEWKEVSDKILATVSLTILIAQVAVTITGMSLVGAILGIVASVPPMLAKTLDSKYKSCHDNLKEEMELISSMKVHAWVELTKLNEIHAVVDRLEKQLQSLTRNANFALGGKENTKLGIGIEEIEKSMDEFTKTLEELGKGVYTCSNHLKNGRLAIQDKINIY